MASEIEIANMAAARVGTETRIASLDDDRVIASKLKTAWNLSRRSALRDGAFNFSTRRTRLAEIVVPDDDKYPWAHAFQEPAESLRLIEVMGVSTDRPCSDFTYENRLILANRAGPLPVRYVVDVDEPALWDALFANAFAAQLALAVGRSIAGSNFDHDGVEREYRRLIAASRRVDARENPPIDMHESSWIDARRGGFVRGERAWG